MISECREHGPFRGDSCPVCGAEGRLVLSDIETDRLGRLMAAVLRHGKYGLEMSPDGYVSADDIAAAARGGGRMGWLTGRHFLAIAATDPRGRYQVLGDRIRATYGHTIDVDLRLPSEGVPPILYYPVSEEEEATVLETGIMPTGRAKVHLSSTPDEAMAAGRVRLGGGKVLLLEIDPAACAAAGFPVGKASDTVCTCDRVPPECLKASDEGPSGNNEGTD